MGLVMFRCPQTGQAVSTGLDVDPLRFRQTPVFFSVSFCPICRTEHQWFAQDVWVHEPAAGAPRWRNSSPPVSARRGRAARLRRGSEHPAPIGDGALRHAERDTIPQQETPT